MDRAAPVPHVAATGAPSFRCIGIVVSRNSSAVNARCRRRIMPRDGTLIRGQGAGPVES